MIMTHDESTGLDGDESAAKTIGELIHAAVLLGLAIGREVKIGRVRGIVIGYNIGRAGDYPGTRYPLLVNTELGIAKVSLDEVVATRTKAGLGTQPSTLSAPA